MGDLYLGLISNIDDLESKLMQIDIFLKNAPDGYITCEKAGSSKRYFSNIFCNDGSLKRTGISKSNRKYAEMLATKRYYTELKPYIENELAKCKKLLTAIEKCDKERIYSKMSPMRKELVSPLFLMPDERAGEWEKYEFTPKEKDINYIKTRNGEQVRSKSEKIIADELLNAGIPYRYECPLKLNGYNNPIYPDFTVLNKRTGKEYYWEHFGKIDDIDYYAGMQRRLDLYSKNDIFIGDKLIFSYESFHLPISTDLISHIIHTFLQ